MSSDKRPTAAEMEEHGRRTVQMGMALEALSDQIEAIYGMFMDSLRGWGHVRRSIETAAKQAVEGGMTMEQVLRSKLTHGKGNPQTGTALHVSTMAERLDACAEGGFNEVILSNLCLVAIYTQWEVHARCAIADALGVRPSDVIAPIFGDLRHMRHCILHAGGVMDERARQLEELKWFKKGDRIVLTQERFHDLIEKLRGFPNPIHTPTYKPFPSLGETQ
ncbi:TPA: hypothetical protein ACKPZU_000078 [Stenotrophomonas maltophilia]|uniref:hypothetical protein n=1 Tax=Stenotrophomonas maltophilia TaxID=40324 RepID=UPI0021C60CD0|nr:hypothetical protein [Stenotrophomonas maltophilia]MCU1173762.1 hypothetical protein [Stenotrophomonas maltophilia]